MYWALVYPFDEEKGSEGQQDDQDGIFHAAGRLLIGIYGDNQGHAEGTLSKIIGICLPLLRKCAVEGQYPPVSDETAVLHRTQVGQVGPRKAGVRPGGGSFYLCLAACGDEGKVACPLEANGRRKVQWLFGSLRQPSRERGAECAFELIGRKFIRFEIEIGYSGSALPPFTISI